MARSSLLQAVCTVALLAAAPALAQQSNTSGSTPPSSAATPPSGATAQAQPATPGNNPVASQSGNVVPPEKMGAVPPEKMGSAESAMPQEHHMTHRSAMAHNDRSMRGKTDTSQNGEIDQLNDRSYQAAQKGQAMAAGGPDNNTASPMPSNGAGSNTNGAGTPPESTGSTGENTK